MSSQEVNIKDADRTDIIRKGNELFNKGDIILAYKCYTMADYSAGVEKVADHYFYTEKSPAKAIVLYKSILKDDSNMGGNERVKEKLESVAKKIVEVIRKWVAEDDIPLNNKKEVTLEEKRKYLLALVDQQKNRFHSKEESSKKPSNGNVKVEKHSSIDIHQKKHHKK